MYKLNSTPDQRSPWSPIFFPKRMNSENSPAHLTLLLARSPIVFKNRGEIGEAPLHRSIFHGLLWMTISNAFEKWANVKYTASIDHWCHAWMIACLFEPISHSMQNHCREYPNWQREDSSWSATSRAAILGFSYWCKVTICPAVEKNYVMVDKIRASPKFTSVSIAARAFKKTVFIT